MLWRAKVAYSYIRPRLESLLERSCQSRFADARLACKQNHATFALRGLVPAPQKQLQFLFAPYQRGKAGLVLRLETTLHRACGKYLPCLDWIGQALERYPSQIAVFEEPASQPSRARRDHHLSGSASSVDGQPSWGLAYHGLLPRCTLPNQVANHHYAGRDADAHLKGSPMAGLKSGRRLDQCESATHRMFGVVLVGLRIAEVGKHPIAHVFGDKPARLPITSAQR